MSREILLGVDGGNTKTDFFLFSTDGECLGYLKTGTSSHERLADGYDGTRRVLQERINEVCHRAGITLDEIKCAVFGLAGADTPRQHRKLHEITQEILNCRTIVCNDSILGIMAAAPGCVGVCCINGTGTSVGGIDDTGNTLQVGGFGDLSSDFAGGMFAAKEVLRYIYTEKYRCGVRTTLTKGLYKLFDVDDNTNLMEILDPEKFELTKEIELNLNRLLFNAANDGDEVAQKILNKMAVDMAQSTIGCIRGLKFTENVTIVLAGSLWVKGGYTGMQELFAEYVRSNSAIECEIVILKEAPAIGAVFGAYKYLKNEAPSSAIRQKICDEINNLI